ncbi:MAG TPA: acetate--CoA ligase family protein, partial [Acidimicrobiia bacterium]|nr:acetate--CoA ligase family protein [Acidimicrobiia bacterium]
PAKPIVANFLGLDGIPDALRGERRGHEHEAGAQPGTRCLIPSFAFPEVAARALGRAADYAAWRERPPGLPAKVEGIDLQAARAVVDRALAGAGGEGDGDVWLDFITAAELLDAYGIGAAPAVRAASPEDAADAAGRLGFPVALKVGAGAIVHKTDVGGVRLGLTSPDDVRSAYEQMTGRLGGAMGGVIVQKMADPGVETIVGVVRDPVFGPLIMFGIGGIATELVGDRTFGVVPLTDRDAAEMVRSLRSTPLLTGFRGSQPVDLAALEDVLLRVAHLAEQVPEVAEMDLNPVIATPAGAVTVDCKIRLVRAEVRHERDLRRLR